VDSRPAGGPVEGWQLRNCATVVLILMRAHGRPDWSRGECRLFAKGISPRALETISESIWRAGKNLKVELNRGPWSWAFCRA